MNPRVLKLPLEVLMGYLPSKTEDQPETGHASVGGSGLAARGRGWRHEEFFGI